MRTRSAFTLLEVLMAIAILGFCLVPIMTHSQSTVRETEESQESLLARQYLIDLIERYRTSTIFELRLLPSNEPAVALGSEPDYIKNDAILADKARVAQELEDLARNRNYVDGGQKGFSRMINTTKLMKLTGVVWFKEGSPTPNLNQIFCKVRWQSAASKGEKTLEMTKILVP